MTQIRFSFVALCCGTLLLAAGCEALTSIDSSAIPLPGCPAGYVECAGMCSDLNVSPQNCGACGNTCQYAETCQNGSCECLSGYSRCGGICTDVRSDYRNCGSCGAFCTLTCSGGICDCYYGTQNCGQTCISLYDSQNCLECGNVCPSGWICGAGGCIDLDAGPSDAADSSEDAFDGGSDADADASDDVWDGGEDAPPE